MRTVMLIISLILSSGCAHMTGGRPITKDSSIDTSKAYILVGTVRGNPQWFELRYCTFICMQWYDLEPDSKLHIYKLSVNSSFKINLVNYYGDIEGAISLTPTRPGLYYYGNISDSREFGPLLSSHLWKFENGTMKKILTDDQLEVINILKEKHPDLYNAFGGEINGL